MLTVVGLRRLWTLLIAFGDDRSVQLIEVKARLLECGSCLIDSVEGLMLFGPKVAKIAVALRQDLETLQRFVVSG